MIEGVQPRTRGALPHRRVPTELDRFRVAYREAVSELVPFLTPERLEVIARHNPGWQPARFDFRAYLRDSERRYVKALESFRRFHASPSLEGLRVLDAGGFIGAFPLALRKLGVGVALAEKYGFYYGAFDDLRAYLESQGVEALDLDLTKPLDHISGRYDLVTSMALLEHLPYSPQTLLLNLHALVEPDGKLIVEVPNMAYWARRLQLFMGVSPLAPFDDLYHSEEPFTGHHREYTVRELEQALEWSGFRVHEVITFNYSPIPGGLGYRLLFGLPRRVTAFREQLLACASPRPTSS